MDICVKPPAEVGVQSVSCAFFFSSSFYWCSCKSVQNLWMKSVLVSCPLCLACWRRSLKELKRNEFQFFWGVVHNDTASEKYHPRGTSNTSVITCHFINAENSAPTTNWNHSASESRQQIGSILRGLGLIFAVNETCLIWIASVPAQTKVYISEFISSYMSHPGTHQSISTIFR